MIREVNMMMMMMMLVSMMMNGVEAEGANEMKKYKDMDFGYC
jgi:hypothetical protein